jgi:transglutaminase-like putative cysteine protease
MKVYKIITDGTAKATGRIMRQVVERFYLDMAPYASYSLLRIFDVIKNLPYRPDPINVETLMRPSHTLAGRGTGGDCDCKAVALASWARLQQIPYQFIAIRRIGRKNLHHVAVELYTHNEWIFCDPTYSFNVIGRKREEAERVVL